MKTALKKAAATFVFSTTGMLIGVNVLDADLALWKQVASAGIGSLLNFAYRWAEDAMKTFE